MCGCEAHWKTSVPCTCSCPEHAAIRVWYLPKTPPTNTANAGSWLRKPTDGAWHHHITVSAGGTHTYYVDGQVVTGDGASPAPEDDGPTEDEIARAIDSIKRAQEDEEES